MCGFTGFFETGSPSYDRKEIAKKMADTIKHRGPDSDGLFSDEYVTLAFRRLSIIDLAGGDQPIFSEDGRYVVVFNGEIYNYLELRKELTEKYGRKFSTNSDTESIVEAYSVFGEETASHLRGMFAFVIYDTVLHTLYGARDYFGIKPFYYGIFGDTFLFGSEIKSFLPHPAFKKELNDDALKMYLEFQYSPMKECIFKNVFKLTQGHFFTYKKGVFEEKAYFTPELDPKNRGYEETVKLIDETVKSSVEYHRISDVEVGFFLSGGVDSSYMASLISETKTEPMKTYSVGFRIDGFDETNLAHGLCEILKVPHRIKEIDPDDFFNALPMVQYHSDEPHANLSAVPLYYLASLASEDVKVVLSGEGADEFFGGYDWYIQSGFSRVYKKLPQGLRNVFAKTLGKIPQKHIKRFFTDNAKRVEDTYVGQAFIMDDALADRLINKSHASKMTFRDVTAPFYDKVRGCDDLTKKMYLDMNLWLPGDILLKADKMSMAHSLEARVPYLDIKVWDVARTLTSAQKMKGRHTKRAFRTAANRHIPEEWANRKKAGFMVPFRVWIKEDRFKSKVESYFNKDYAKEFFDTELLKTMLEEHVSGKKNNARVIYTVLSFLIWYEQYFVLR